MDNRIFGYKWNLLSHLKNENHLFKAMDFSYNLTIFIEERRGTKMRELHLHLDGSLRPKTVFELYCEEKIVPPCEDAFLMKKILTASSDTKNLEELLRAFRIPIRVLQREYALKRVSEELVGDLAKAGNEYAEIRFAPQYSTKEGLSQSQVVDAVISGVKEGMKKNPSIEVKLLLCMMRGGTKEMNRETVEVAHRYFGNVVCGIDLAGDESHYPCSLYEDEFALARSYHIPFTIHAGECGSIENVRDAIKYGARRLGHGVSLIQDKELMHIVREEGILIECCLTSNLQTKAVRDIRKHPIREFYDSGIRVSLNSDNMTVSDTDIQKERKIAKDSLSFTDEELSILDRYSLEASF